MINRVLIRIKVIQTLYSFLLVEKQFSIEDAPSSPTREKRFAYSLYLDMLALMVKIAGNVERANKEYPLQNTKFIARLSSDETIQGTLARDKADGNKIDNLLPGLTEKIKESGIFKTYLKDRTKAEVAGEENLWADLFNLIIARSPEVNSYAEHLENFSPKGVERMKEMVNETLKNFMASQDNVSEVVKALENSLDKSRELYFRMLRLPVELTDIQDRIIDDNRHKFIKSEEDLNPNMRFVENMLVEALRTDPVINKYVSDHKLNWDLEDPDMMRKLLSDIKDSGIYAEYMEAPSTDAHKDAEFWREVLKKIILENRYFLEALEEKSVFWNDDIDIISTFVMKTFRRMEREDHSGAVLEKFKDEEDARFGQELIRCVSKHKDEYREYVNEALKSGNWEAERLAFMDVVVLITAIAEIMNFPKIPLQVSVNEYIEIAKSYSSAKSGVFVNGILGAVLSRLQKEGKLYKK